MNNSQQTPKQIARTLVAVFVSFIVSAGLVALGGVASYYSGFAVNENLTLIMYLVTTGLLVLSVVVGYTAGHIFIKKMNQIPIAQRINMMKSQQSATRDSLDWAEARLRRVQAGFVLTYVWYVLLMVVLSLTVYTADFDLMLVRCILPWVGWSMLLMHLRNAFPSYDFTHYVTKEDFPHIYSIAEKAKNTFGIKGDIKIIFQNDCNAGIQRIGRVYSLQLGLHLMSILTEEELYQVLLHEFAHMTDVHVKSNQGLRLRLNFIANAEQSVFPLSQLTFYAQIKFLFEFMMYQALASEQMEQRADALMREMGDPKVSMTALCKTGLQSFFEREFETFVPEPFHAPETPRDNMVTLQCEALRKAITERGEFWLHLLDIELPPQVQSHPTFKQRREALGMADTPIVLTLPTEDSAYGCECKKATQLWDKKLHEAISEGYEEARKEFYLKPLSVIEDYENATVPYTTAELSPVINAYRDLCRKSEAVAICDQILATETNKFATAHALYFKGRYLLDHYDPQGMDYIYQAIDLNMNYAEEGLDAIGMFCCMMGLEAEREVYREKYITLTQERMDKHDQAGCLNASDNLVEENFPDDRLDAMLLFMKRAGNGCIWQIHLVRKVITEDFFASAFVIRFVEGTAPEQVQKTMEAIFNFLDTTPEDWQYALFLYDKEIEKALHKVPKSCVWDCTKV